MSWFVVFLMLLAFAMMVGPILLVQPSRRDRKVAGMRAKASQLGLRVSLQKLGEDNLAVYELPWSRTDQRPLMGVEWMLERKPYAHDIHLAQWWEWQGAGRPLPPVSAILEERLQLLPESVAALEANRLGLRCYWSEAGGEKGLATLAEWLKETAQLMTPYIYRPSAPVE